MGQNHRALRLWSTVLIAVGVLGVAFVVIGTVVAVMEAVAFWQTLAILLISGPLVAVFASRPLPLGQGLRALADGAKNVQTQKRPVRGRPTR